MNKPFQPLKIEINPDIKKTEHHTVYTCWDCEETFDADQCPTQPDGDWETGYYDIHICPKCGSDNGETEIATIFPLNEEGQQ